jgi:hypothetical protein
MAELLAETRCWKYNKKFIYKIRVHLLVCNTFCLFNECTVYGIYQSKFSYLEFYIIDF